jgi:hypothetical protein
MTDLLSDDTDFEISKYYEASDMIDAGINPAIEKNKKSVFNPETGMNDVLLPMSSGGYVKVSEESPQVMAEAPMQPTMPSMADLGPTQGAADVPKSPMRLAGVVPSKTSSSGNVISETVKGLARGGIVRPAQFLKENFGIYDPLVIQIVNPVTGEFDPDLKILSREEKEQLDADMAAGNLPYAFDFEKIVETSENAGIAAQLAGGISQFVGAFAGLGKLFRIGKGITGGITQGASADFLAFRGDEGRITDLLLEMGVDESLVPSFLVTDPNDPDYVGRFKTAFEGGVFGALAEPAIRAIGKTYRGIKDGDMPAEEIDQAVEAGKQGLLQTVIDRLNQPGPMPTTSMFGAGEIDRGLAAAGRLVAPKLEDGLPGRISTRLPTAKAATEDPMTGELIVGLEEMKADPALYQFNVDITKDYPNMQTVEGESVDDTAERFIEHVKDNLLYLHDKVPADTRVRSQKWYDGARAITDRWSEEYGVPDTSIAGALAALSPQKDWYQNVSLGQRVLDVAIKQKDFVFANEMEQTFRALPSLNKPKYEPMLEAIKGKSYTEIVDEDPAVQATLRALFVRLYDQTYNKPDYRIVGPEGDFLDIATNADGSPSKAAWGSLNEIGKAVASIDAMGDVNTISLLMGERHKVRNFYNNIYDPNSPFGDVTIDTHAVAAGLLRPLSGNSLEVDHNFKNMSVKGRGTTKGSTKSGVSGNYALYAEAYRRAAAERGILPRQMQSITWEAVRGLFTDKFKQSAKNVADVDAIWQRYKNGEIDLDETRRLVDERAGGINPPSWE